MSSVVAWLIATIITLPIVGWYLIYFVTVKLTRRKPTAVRVASDISAIFFIIAVNVISYELWEQSFLSVILITICVIAIMLTLIHWKIAGDIRIGRLLKGVLRFNFLLFGSIYLVLCVYGLVISIS